MSDTLSRTLSAVLTNQLSEVKRLGEMAERFAESHGLSEDERYAINLVLDEIVINVIKYGFDDTREHQIHVTLSVDAGTLTIVVDDDARAFNPLDQPPPDLDLPIEERPIGGLGIFLVRATMDDVQYERSGDRNVLTLKKKLAE